MRQVGSTSNVASVVVVGVDPRAMGQIRETLGAEAALPSQATKYEDALAVIRKLRPDVVIASIASPWNSSTLKFAPCAEIRPIRCKTRSFG